MRTPFSLEEYKQHPDWKIETRDGRNVKIIYTDRLSERCIIALIDGWDACYYFANGRGYGAQGRNCEDDLFFVVNQEGEPSAFEKKITQIISSRDRDNEWPYDDEKLTASEVAHTVSKELLELAKKELNSEDDNEILTALHKYFSAPGITEISEEKNRK